MKCFVTEVPDMTFCRASGHDVGLPVRVVLGLSMLLPLVHGCAAEDEGRDSFASAWTAPTVTYVGPPGGPRMTIQEDTVPACGYCELVLEPIGGFGQMNDPVLLRSYPRVDRDSRGRFYATVPAMRDHEIIVYSSSGATLGMVGRYGDGPGEFTTLWDLFVGPGDTLWVGHDAAVTLFDPDGAYARRLSLTPPPRSPELNRIVTPYDGGVLLTEYRRGDISGRPVHQYDREGQYVQGFGPADIGQRHELDRGALMSTFPRVAAWDVQGTIWLAGPGYRIEGIGLRTIVWTLTDDGGILGA